MNRRPPPRRAHTRWILIGSAVVIALLVAGAAWLEAIHPQLDPTGNAVDGVPPIAYDEAPTCRRLVDEGPIEEVRDAFPRGGRVSSEQVYRCPAAYDGIEVTFVGEVVGDVLRRRGGAWAQVNDDAYALVTGPLVGHRERAGFNSGLSVWLEDDLADAIEAPGRAARRGDVVLLTGTVLRADPDDGGGITLRADSLTTLAGPLEVEPPLHVTQVIVAVVLGLLATAATIWAYRVRQR